MLAGPRVRGHTLAKTHQANSLNKFPLPQGEGWGEGEKYEYLPASEFKPPHGANRMS